jgi:hypothetical protein
MCVAAGIGFTANKENKDDKLDDNNVINAVEKTKAILTSKYV